MYLTSALAGKAKVQEGPRKGQPCQFPPVLDGYCNRHPRNKIYDEGLAEGKRWCRFFFRGCDSVLTEKTGLTCNKCKEEYSKKKHSCKHDGCCKKVLEEGFCGKHTRDKYRLEEKDKGIKYCDIGRGCFNILTTRKSCDSCLEKDRKYDNARFNERKLMSKIAGSTGSNKRTCAYCGKEYESYLTRYGKESITCTKCQDHQNKVDELRKDRVRNYKEEHFHNLRTYYNGCIHKSEVRGKGDFDIDFLLFCELVTQPCYYCKSITEGETNGIDRVNNNKGYVKDNCVTACWKCNRMKHMYHPLFFIQKCKFIANNEKPTKSFYKKWDTYYYSDFVKCYEKDKYNAEVVRGLPYKIPYETWDEITQKPCYLCGYQSQKGIGIDRLDNNIREYNVSNIKPCCKSCNNMKNELSLSDFLIQCNKIAIKWADEEIFSKVPMNKYSEDNKITENPVPEEEPRISEPTELEARCHWRAEGVYQAIMNEKGDEFYIMHKDHYKEKEFQDLCILVKNATKEVALNIIRRLLSTLKKRKYRNNKSHLTNTIS